MSIRIHSAIGYGMPWEKFEVLGGNLKKLTCFDETALVYEPSKDGRFVFYKDLLVKEEDEDGKALKKGKAGELFDIVGYDDNEHIIFFPSLYYRSRWFRFDDDIDYNFARWEGMNERENPVLFDPHLENWIRYVGFGHYPFTNDIIGKDGSKMVWENVYQLKNRDDWIPDPPAEMKYYLRRFNVLDEKGILELRPICARWWS